MPQKTTVGRVVLTSFFVDLLDVIVNLVVMLLTGSVVMVAELAQGGSDLIASGFLLIGLKRPQQEIYIWTVASALMMLLVASLLSIYFGWKRFLAPEPIENILIAYIALGISFISNVYAFTLSARRILRSGQSFRQLFAAFNSSSLIMTKNTFVLDLMGASAAFVGLIALILYQLLGEFRFDGLGAVAIGVVLALLSFHLLWDIKHMAGKTVVKGEL
ncbi:cation transporter [Patescibacteria group bacterium]|nr:cation transporter [Patescibacteria group bacterium]